MNTTTACSLLLGAQLMAATSAWAFAKPAVQAVTHHSQRPNIIVILTDDMGYSDIGAFGSEIRTPTLDRLAHGGAVFTQFYNTARCCPSRASLLTGLHPHQAGIGHLIFQTPHDGYGDRLRADTLTVAEALKTAGYGTYMAGKWHVAPRSYNPATDSEHWPTGRGFDRFYGTIAGSGSFFDPSTLCRDTTLITPENDPLYRPARFYYTDAITDNALMFLEDHAAQQPTQPFFLYLAYTAAHWPLHAPEESIAPYRGQYDAGYEAIHAARAQRLAASGLLPEVGDIAPPVARWDDVKDKRAEASLMEAYAAMITHMDDGIGRIVALLEGSGALENTLIVYLHDNGACAEDWFSDELTITRPLKPMAADELQRRALPPMQTRDGRPVRAGLNVIAGPDDTYTGYKEAWANVSNTPFRWYKHYMHEGGISTPFIAHWPAGMPQPAAGAGLRVVREPAHIIDIMATCLDLAGVPYPAVRAGVPLQPLAGISLRPALTGEGNLERPTPLFWEHESNRAVRDGRWKLVALEGQPWELYDLETDRGETRNLAQQQPATVARLAAAWDDWAASHRVLPLGGWRDQAESVVAATQPNRVELRQGDQVPAARSPFIAGHGVRVTAEVLAGPVDGVIAAHGGRVHGYAVYVESGEVVFAVRRNRDLYRLTSGPLPNPPFTVEALLRADGTARLSVGDTEIDSKYWGPFVLNPSAGISVGADPQVVSRYAAGPQPFSGQLGAVAIEAVR
jgi:arylsulfatase A-like enzyme